MAMTDEGLTIEEGRERKRRAPTVTESTLWDLGYHDGIHGLTDETWARDAEYRRGRLAAHRLLTGVA
jgi:hypothetical protein